MSVRSFWERINGVPTVEDIDKVFSTRDYTEKFGDVVRRISRGAFASPKS